MAESRFGPPRESLLCRLGWHAPQKGALWNEGYYFSRCGRCRSDLVRTTYSGWEVPRGFRIVWKPRPVDPDAGPPAPGTWDELRTTAPSAGELAAPAPPAPQPAAVEAALGDHASAPSATVDLVREPRPALRKPVRDEPSLDSMIERASVALNGRPTRTRPLRKDAVPPAAEPAAAPDLPAQPLNPSSRLEAALPEPAPAEDQPAPAPAMPAEAASPPSETPVIEVRPETVAEQDPEPAPAPPAIPSQTASAEPGAADGADDAPPPEPAARNRSTIPDFMDDPQPSALGQPHAATLPKAAARPAGTSNAGS